MKIAGIAFILTILFLTHGCKNQEPPIEGENFQEYINENAVQDPEPPTLSENALIDVPF